MTFFPKANALVINDDALERLDDEQREVLENAAAQTRDWAIENLPSDAEQADAYCDAGGAVVLASDSELAALERATAPVSAALERDGPTRELIEAIRARKGEVAAAAPAAACGTPLGRDATRSGGTADKRFDGVYRFEITDAELRHAGITERPDLEENHGIFTLTLEDGIYCWEQRAPNPLNNPDECSTYEVKGDRVVWHFPVDPPDVYRFKQAADGSLHVTLLRAGTSEFRPYAEAWAANVWMRLGGG